jgi:hypothetical protein
MAVAHLTRCTLHGVGMGEEFQVSVSVVGGVFPGYSDLSAAADDSVVALVGASEWAQIKAMISSDQRWDKVRLEYFNPTGGPAEFSAEATIASADGTGTGSAYAALQTSFVCTLYTERAGAHGRGRIYWPLTGAEPPAGHLMSSTFTDAVGGASKALMRAFESAIATHGGGVANTHVYSPSTGTSSLVNRVSVDNRPDIQRRRAESLVPTHVYTDAYTG